jgi:hypothetical protein
LVRALKALPLSPSRQASYGCYAKIRISFCAVKEILLEKRQTKAGGDHPIRWILASMALWYVNITSTKASF